MYRSGEKNSDEYWKNIKVSWHLKDVCNNCEGLEDFIHEVMDQAFALLDAFDRDESFWVPGNKLATYYKLSGFSDILIVREIDPVVGAWCKIFMGMIDSHEYQFELRYWEVLKHENQLNLAWLVRTAWNVVPVWGEETAEKLSRIVVALKLEGEAIRYLDTVSSEVGFESERAKEWVVSVTRRIQVVPVGL